MLPKYHIAFGAIASIIIFIIFPKIGISGALIILLSSFLIDFDHYLYYVYKKRKLGLKGAYHWYSKKCELFKNLKKEEKEKIYTGLCCFHGIESLLILLFLSFLCYFFFPKYLIFSILVLFGFIFHQFLDAIDLYIKDYRFDKIISWVYSARNSKNKKLLQG